MLLPSPSPPRLRASQAAQPRAPAQALQPSPSFPPPCPYRPSQSRPTLAFGPPPTAARCQRAAAPPLRESADARGGASGALRREFAVCGGGGTAVGGGKRLWVKGKAVGQSKLALPFADRRKSLLCCKNGQNILATRSWHPKGKP